MATFYGTLKGNHQVVTRTGSKASGINASVQSWQGSVITRMADAGTGTPFIEIEIAEGSASSGQTVFFGTIEELRNKLK